MKHYYKLRKKIIRYIEICLYTLDCRCRYKFLIAFQNKDGSFFKWNSIHPVEMHPGLALLRLRHIKKVVNYKNRRVF